MHADRSDQAWVDGLKEGTVISDLRDYLRRTLAKGFGHELQGADLEDLTQESLLRVHQKLDTFEGQSRFATWAGRSPSTVRSRSYDAGVTSM